MAESNRTKNSARNIFWGILLKLTATVIPFVNRTVIIHTLGLEYTGISSLFTSILSVLSLAELGISSAILFSMYRSIAEEDYRKTNALLLFYKKAYAVIGSIVLCIGLLICIRLDLFIAGDYPKGINIYIVYLLFLANSVASYFFFAYSALILTANQREDINHRINIAVTLVREIIQFFVLVVTSNYYIYVFLAIVATIIHNVWVYLEAKKKYPRLIAEGNLSKDEKKSLQKQIAGLVIGKLSVVSRNSFDSIVISAFLGLIPAAIYGNYYYIMNAIFGLIFYFCSGMRASIGNKIATRSVQENYVDMLSFSYGFYVIYGTCTVCLFCAYQPFMKMWVGYENMASSILPLLMCLYFFLFCSVGIISQYWEAAGLFWENRIRFIIEAITNLVLNIILVQFWGLNGIISATIVSMFFATNILGPQISFKYYFKDCNIWGYYKKQIIYLMITVIMCALCYWGCSKIYIEGIHGLLTKCVLCGMFSLSANALLFSKTPEFNKMYNLSYQLLLKKMRISKNKLICSFTVILVLSIIGFSYFFTNPSQNVSDAIQRNEEKITEVKPITTIPFSQLHSTNFTCTGMTYSFENNTLWIADYGSLSRSDYTVPTIHEFDLNSNAEVRQIKLSGGV